MEEEVVLILSTEDIEDGGSEKQLRVELSKGGDRISLDISSSQLSYFGLLRASASYCDTTGGHCSPRLICSERAVKVLFAPPSSH